MRYGMLLSAVERIKLHLNESKKYFNTICWFVVSDFSFLGLLGDGRYLRNRDCAVQVRHLCPNNFRVKVAISGSYKVYLVYFKLLSILSLFFQIFHQKNYAA